MATRRITQAERESATEADAEYIANDDAKYDADTEEAIHTFRDALAGSENKGTLWVYRLQTDERGEVIANAKPASLFNAPIDRFELEELSSRLRREYMSPGERAVFRLTITQRGSQGLKLNRLLILERERQRTEDQTNGRESIAELLRVMQEANQAAADRTERLLGALHVQRTPATDPMQQSLAIVAAITGLTQSLVRQSSGATPLAGVSVDPMTSIETTMRVMSRMRSFFDGGGGGESGDPDGLAAILRAAGPIVATIGELARRQPMLPAQAALANRRRRARAASAPNAAPSTTPEGEQMIAQLRPQFEALVAAAKDGGDPVAIAPLVLDAIPEGTPIEARFVEFLQRPDWFATVVAVYAPARDHAEWFAKLRDAILSEFESDASA